MYRRQFFLDKGTCQGKLASVNEAYSILNFGDGEDDRMYVLLLFIQSEATREEEAEFCPLLIGWRSVHVTIRKRTSASDRLGERPLVPASLLEFSIRVPSPTPTTLVLWYGLICDSGGASDRENLACGSYS